MRVLITGVAGFVGRHLAEHLGSESQHEIWGVVRRLEGATGHLPAVRLLKADLREREQVRAAVCEARPDHVYHLAAQSSVATSLRDPLSTIVNNITAQINLLEEIAGAVPDARILVVGSAEEYGLTEPGELPIVETKELRPINPYAVSKVAQDMLALQYCHTRKLKIVRVRPFGQLGPGQSDAFVAPAFARQIAEIEAGFREPVIGVGYLEGQRDFTDVRDVVKGYRGVLRMGTPGEVYNLGSERPRTIRSLLDGLLAHSAIQPRLEFDSARMRPTEVPIFYADCSKLRKATDWRPTIPIRQTLRDVLEDWRNRVNAR